MTQSGQGEEPSARPAREGIVLPSDGGAPLHPSDLPPAPLPPAPVQPWDQQRQWGPEEAGSPAQPSADHWHSTPPGAARSEWGGQGAHDAYGAQGGHAGYGTHGAGYGTAGRVRHSGRAAVAARRVPRGRGRRTGPRGTAERGRVLRCRRSRVRCPCRRPPRRRWTRAPPSTSRRAVGRGRAGGRRGDAVHTAGDRAGARRGGSHAVPAAGRAGRAAAGGVGRGDGVPGAGAGPRCRAPAAHREPRTAPARGARGEPDAEPTQFIPPVAAQAQPRQQSYGAPGQRRAQQQPQQQPDVFDSLFRSEAGAAGAAGGTQQMPRIEHTHAPQPPQGPGGHGGQGGHAPGGHGDPAVTVGGPPRDGTAAGAERAAVRIPGCRSSRSSGWGSPCSGSGRVP